MKGLLLIVICMVANVVGAGVWMVLAMIIDNATDGQSNPIALFLATIVSVVCAIFFCMGAIDSLSRLQFPKRRGGARS